MWNHLICIERSIVFLRVKQKEDICTLLGWETTFTLCFQAITSNFQAISRESLACLHMLWIKIYCFYMTLISN